MIRPEFQVHMLNDQGKQKATELARLFSVFLNGVESLIGTEGREIAIVRTKLEECSYFAKRAMASRAENQQ